MYTPPVKAATVICKNADFVVVFQSTPPVKAATLLPLREIALSEFQSTPPVKAATDIDEATGGRIVISIHAAREGGDCGNE